MQKQARLKRIRRTHNQHKFRRINLQRHYVTSYFSDPENDQDFKPLKRTEVDCSAISRLSQLEKMQTFFLLSLPDLESGNEVDLLYKRVLNENKRNYDDDGNGLESNDARRETEAFLVGRRLRRVS